MELTFGKYKGQSIESILKIDSKYVMWLATSFSNDDVRKFAQSLFVDIKFMDNYKKRVIYPFGIKEVKMIYLNTIIL